MNRTELTRLQTEWRAALDRKERHGTDADDLAEQEAFDALVDYIEENDLNYTEHDPRGAAA